ncbi:hypothetical protein, partial [Streptomyces sp. NPDC005486]|uniref:hypothetical protein n=1 Tax=Streptomyces sp. NPDC005486 TaxID=3155345 RepID=UPI0033A57551
GIKVKLEVVPWSDLLNRILTATTSGQGPGDARDATRRSRGPDVLARRRRAALRTARRRQRQNGHSTSRE